MYHFQPSLSMFDDRLLKQEILRSRRLQESTPAPVQRGETNLTEVASATLLYLVGHLGSIHYNQAQIRSILYTLPGDSVGSPD